MLSVSISWSETSFLSWYVRSSSTAYTFKPELVLEPIHNLSEILFIYSHILATVSLFSRPGQNCYIPLCYLSFQQVKKDPEQALRASALTVPWLLRYPERSCSSLQAFCLTALLWTRPPRP